MYDADRQRAWDESPTRAVVKRRMRRFMLPALAVSVGMIALRATVLRNGPAALQGLVTLVILASAAQNFWVLRINQREMRAGRECYERGMR